GPLYLKNKTIVAFQRDIGVDVVSPLDLITPPGDKRTDARKKMLSTIKRIEQVLPLCGESTLIGVGQGGRFMDLRGQAMEMLAELGVSYAALGALVPFFNRNHDLNFVGQVIKQARAILPQSVPIHLYGGGDPLELPFYMALGCDIFDSSSFVHYAIGGWYMTPYGALKREEMDLKNPPYCCPCPQCTQGIEKVYQDTVSLARHNLWVIVHTVQKASGLLKEGLLDGHLMHIAARHMELFPSSRLAGSWQALEPGRGA
ncbi:MAG: tRNA-guanine transglycosylase, partial [Desulfatibacillaceae bacterium]|nr:tRNA-guanine transglycosylase [Desulfatibacillaceae bacterium]